MWHKSTIPHSNKFSTGSMTDPKEKTVYFVRHGQSVDNTAPVFQGANTPLSITGIRQAETTAERLAQLEFEALISSPLPRARQTTELIAKATNKEPVFNELFVERIKPSQIDGQAWGDEANEKLFREWQDSLFSHDKRTADGENFLDLVMRADSALQYLTDRPEQRIVVVTHGFFLTAIIARAICGTGLTPQLLKGFQLNTMLGNASISTLRYVNDRHDANYVWRLWAFNDLTHFAE